MVRAFLVPGLARWPPGRLPPIRWNLPVVADDGCGFLAHPGPPRIKPFPDIARRLLAPQVIGTPMNGRSVAAPRAGRGRPCGPTWTPGANGNRSDPNAVSLCLDRQFLPCGEAQASPYAPGVQLST